MQSEATIILKGEDSTFKKKFLCYSPIRIDSECPHIMEMVEQAKAEYKGTPEEVILKITCKIE